MSEEFLFPDVGEGIAEGKLVEWKVQPGDEVAEDQVVADVETDKAVVEIPSPRAGTIQELNFESGDTVHVGDVLLTFGDPASGSEAEQSSESEGSSEQSSDSQEPSEQSAKSSSKQPKTKDHEVEDDHEREPERGTKKVESSLTPTAPKPEQHEPPVTVREQSTDAQGPTKDQHERVLAAPSTRRLAREQGVDISTIEGSGPHGRVLKSDVEAASSGKQPAQEHHEPAPAPKASPAKPAAPPQEKPAAEEPAPASQSGRDEAHPQATPADTLSYSGRRKAIGEHMVASSQVPAVTEFARADVSALVELREHLKPKAAEMGVKLSFLGFFGKAVCAALRKFPVLNSHFSDEGIQVFDDVHLGIAVDTEEGLVVPVIQDADRKSVIEIASDVKQLAEQARSNKLSREQMSGSTFSISSIGPLRVDEFTPMINTPEAAILGIGGIRERPWAVDGSVSVRKVVALSLTFDHRVVDGAEAARFLSYLVELLEDPELLVLGGV